MFTSVLGKKIHYQFIEERWLDDDRPLLVFLHEGLGSIGQWKDFPAKLSSKLQLPALVYERVGYGKSDYWDGPVSSRFLYFEALIILPQLLESLQLTNPIILFGHSDGATIGLIQCSQPMTQLMAAIIEAPHVTMEEHSIKGLEKVREMLDNSELLAAMDRYQEGRAYQLIDDWSSHWLKANPNDWEVVEALKKIETPLLLIQGDLDEFGTFAQLEQIEEHAQSELLLVEKLKECGHMPHLQQQEVVLDLSKNFIEKILS